MTELKIKAMFEVLVVVTVLFLIQQQPKPVMGDRGIETDPDEEEDMLFI